MKIWVQSGGAIGKDPQMGIYEQSLKRHVQEAARPDTIVDVYGVDLAPPRPDMYHLSEHVQVSSLMTNARRAEKEGYDAFVVVCTADPGFYELREMLNIPVVFILESSLHLACLLAAKFSFLTHNEWLLLRVTERVKNYGLVERMTKGACLDLSHKDFNIMYENPQPYLDALVEKGREVVAQGANIILVSGNPVHLFLFEHGVREIDGVPILDVCRVAVKFGEFRVELNNMGINSSKKGLYIAPSKEELATILQLNRA
ncbi:aspartate/glutamate racemase family protein [Chloroflexota bacterium]